MVWILFERRVHGASRVGVALFDGTVAIFYRIYATLKESSVRTKGKS